MGAKHRIWGREMLPMLVVASFSIEEAEHFCKVVGVSIAAVSIAAAGSPHSVVDTFNCRQLSGLN